MQVNPAYGPPPGYGPPAPPNMPQPVTYRPGGSPYGMMDTYQPNRPPGAGFGQPPQQEEYKYVAQQDVAFGLAGAVGGFLLFGPIGALIGGLGLLLISCIIRGVKHMSDKKKVEEQQKQQQMPAPPQYPYPNGAAPQGYQYQNQYNYGQNQNSAYRDPNQQYMQYQGRR